MSTPLSVGPLPAWVPELARRRFRFSPAIAGTVHNEWTLREVTWADVVVENAVSREALSIPRRFFGDAQHIEDAVGVVTLLKKLEWSQNRVRPLDRAVIELRPTDGPRVRAARPAQVVAIRETPQPVPRWQRFFRVAIALACLMGFVAVYVLRDTRNHGRVKRFSTRPTGLASHPPALEPLTLPERR